jgi:hypothetical protein
VVAPSGRFLQPTRIPGKNYFKDEVVIRNADSGKVMGLKGRRVHMIEELTETIISFQRWAAGRSIIAAQGGARRKGAPRPDHRPGAGEDPAGQGADRGHHQEEPVAAAEGGGGEMLEWETGGPQVEEEVESLCAAQEMADSKRNTLVAEREAS